MIPSNKKGPIKCGTQDKNHHQRSLLLGTNSALADMGIFFSPIVGKTTRMGLVIVAVEFWLKKVSVLNEESNFGVVLPINVIDVPHIKPLVIIVAGVPENLQTKRKMGRKRDERQYCKLSNTNQTMKQKATA